MASFFPGKILGLRASPVPKEDSQKNSGIRACAAGSLRARRNKKMGIYRNGELGGTRRRVLGVSVIRRRVKEGFKSRSDQRMGLFEEERDIRLEGGVFVCFGGRV